MDLFGTAGAGASTEDRSCSRFSARVMNAPSWAGGGAESFDDGMLQFVFGSDGSGALDPSFGNGAEELTE